MREENQLIVAAILRVLSSVAFKNLSIVRVVEVEHIFGELREGVHYFVAEHVAEIAVLQGQRRKGRD